MMGAIISESVGGIVGIRTEKEKLIGAMEAEAEHIEEWARKMRADAEHLEKQAERIRADAARRKAES